MVGGDDVSREIKFRARNASVPRCWIYGYFVVENGCHYITNDDGKFPVIVDTECQFTGLYDKNGKEIYEGDVVEKIYGDREGCIKVNGSIKPFLRIVEERYGCFGISPVFSELVHPDDRRWIPIYDQEDEELKTEYLTVVGNIYENPELLEVEGQ